MQPEELEKQSLLDQKREIGSDPRLKEPPILKSRMRPYKGIFLTFFLWFTGMLFFMHGLHKFQDYTWGDLVAVWVLSTLLIIPGAYFGMIIFAIQLKTSGFSYKNHPELYQ